MTAWVKGARPAAGGGAGPLLGLLPVTHPEPQGKGDPETGCGEGMPIPGGRRRDTLHRELTPGLCHEGTGQEGPPLGAAAGQRTQPGGAQACGQGWGLVLEMRGHRRHPGARGQGQREGLPFSGTQDGWQGHQASLTLKLKNK